MTMASIDVTVQPSVTVVAGLGHYTQGGEPQQLRDTFLPRDREQVFTLRAEPIPGTVTVHVNGLEQLDGDFSLDGATLTFLDHPLYQGDAVVVRYRTL